MQIDFSQTHSKTSTSITLPTPMDGDSDNPVVWELSITAATNQVAALQQEKTFVYIYRDTGCKFL